MNRSKNQCVPGLSSYFKYFNLKYLAILFVLMAGLPFHAFGQDATILGTVTDPAGAIVPNVTITITSVETGRVRTYTSNESGQFVAPSLMIGHYNVKAEATGFKIEEVPGVSLSVGDRQRVDIQLRIGSTAESVSVESAAIAVQADTGEISQVVTGTQISQLATNGRSIYTFVTLTTGASSLMPDFQTPTPVGGNSSVSFNGNRPAHNLYLLDGGEGDDRGGAGSFSIMPSVDALAEVQTLTSNYSADYGLSSGGTIATVLKSGTKQFHASAWEYVRNNALNARPFFFPAPLTVPKLNFNTYGFNAGGPVTFGKLYNPDRTKTFFFYNMEWRSLIQGGTINQQVPAADTYGGDLAGTKAAATLAGLHAPYACQVSPAIQTQFATAGQALSGCTAGAPDTALAVPFVYNGTAGVINPALLDPNAQALLFAGGKYGGIFPAANGVNGSGNPTFLGGNNSPTNVREEIVRIDQNFTDKFTMFGHFVAEQITQGYGTTQWSGDNVPTGANNFGNPSYSAVIHTAYVINPNWVNEVAFNYNGNRINITPSGLYTAPADFTFNRLFTGPNALDRIPSIQLNGNLNGTGTNYTSSWEPWVNKADDYQIRDDVSWTHGRHQIKMGGSWALYKKVQDVFTTTQGNFQFNGNFTGNDFADYLLGYGQNYSEDAVKDNGNWNNVSWAAYIQDNYRVNNRLTLNLGLRWDGVPHTYEANHRMSNFYPNLYNPADAATFNTAGTICSGPTDPGCTAASPGLGTSPNPILAGYQFYENGLGLDGLNGTPKGLVNNHWAAFGPRLGFAYDLTGQGKTVIRGGFGIMYERIQGNDVYNTGGNVPFSANFSTNNVLLSDPKTSVTTGNTIVAPPLPIPVAGITGINKYYPLPASYQFSIGVQQALGARTVLSASYVGSQNRHQNLYSEINQPDEGLLAGLIATGNAAYNQDVQYLGYRSIRSSFNEANGDYNSFQVSARGTAWSDLTYQVGYTYSRTNDSYLGGGSGDLNNVSNPYLGWKYDYGPSPFDKRNVAFGNFVYQIPFLKNSENKLLKATLGGWEVSGIVTMSSGAPMNASYGGGVASIVPNTSNRPDLVASVQYPHTVAQWFSPSAFAAPTDGTWGNLPHNYLRGPGRDNWNVSLLKNFVLSESRGSNLQFRAEFFNLWNHTQFQGDNNGGIDTNLSDGNFGAITAAFDPRVIQLGLKLTF
jgi:Carboxypeptidase regulatory-like domain